MSEPATKRPGQPRKFTEAVRRIECDPVPLVYVALLRDLGQLVTGKPNITAGLRYLCQLYIERKEEAASVESPH